MELGKLKAQLREKGFNARIPMVVPGSNRIIWVVVQKASLMEELDKVFPTKVSETGLAFNGENLSPAKAAIASPEPVAVKPAPKAVVADDEDDLLGGSDEDDLLGAPSAPKPAPVDDDEDLLG